MPTEQERDIAALQAQIDAYVASTNAQRARLEELRTVLNTIGTTVYQCGRGAKWEGELLAFIRSELEKF